MEFINTLNQNLENWFLLNHPFYQAWNAGSLSMNTLRLYALEYYHYVEKEPRYISQIHTLCEDIKARQILLNNLIDEEKGENNHPALWLRFVAALCHSRELSPTPKLDSTKALIDGFFALTKTSYATGLGALYAYERQTAKVAKSKIEGLKKHYDIHDPKALEFFATHEAVDEWHTEELEKLILDLDPEMQKQTAKGALEGAKLLWNFLDGLYAH